MTFETHPCGRFGKGVAGILRKAGTAPAFTVLALGSAACDPEFSLTGVEPLLLGGADSGSGTLRTTRGFLDGTWSSQIKVTQPLAGPVSQSCTWVGAGSASNGAAAQDPVAMVDEFLASGHELWAAPVTSVSSVGTSCSWLNFQNVVTEWNGRGPTESQLAFAVVSRSELQSAGSTAPLDAVASQLASLRSVLLSAAATAGLPGVEPVVSADDFQSLVSSVLDPAKPFTPDMLRSLRSASFEPRGIRFIPYLEALRALVLTAPTFVLGLQSGSTSHDRLVPATASTSGDQIDFTFQMRGGAGTPINPRKLSSHIIRVEALIGDSYIQTTAGAEPVVEVAVAPAGTAAWRTVEVVSLQNSAGNMGSQFHPVSVLLDSVARNHFATGAGIEVRFRMRNRGSAATAANVNKIAVISVPRLSLSFTGTTTIHSLTDLMASHPTIYTSSNSVVRPPGYSTSIPLARLIGESERLLSPALGNAVDGVILKTDSSPGAYVGDPATYHEVCGALRAAGKLCLVAAWGSDLQGVSLEMKSELYRYEFARSEADGYLSYNFPLDLASEGEGVMGVPAPLSPQAVARFHWPLETRGLHGFTRTHRIEIPADSPAGAQYRLSGRVASGCALNGLGESIWTLGLEAPSDPANSFRGLAIQDAAGLTFADRIFAAEPGDAIEISVSLVRSVGSARCDVDFFLTPPMGFGTPGASFAATTFTDVDGKARKFYSCFSDLFRTGSLSDPESCH